MFPMWTEETENNELDKFRSIEEELLTAYDSKETRHNCLSQSCLKSIIPLSKLKGLQDEVDIPDIVEFRCDTCSNCPVCKMSARAKTKSLQEEFEQSVIIKSVRVDLDEQTTFVDLPFIKDPVAHLTKKHKGSDNFYQARKIYEGQCRKSDEVKEQVRAAHKDLAEKEYMVRLKELPQETQDLINAAPFKHAYPWRAVYKLDSATTPVRIIVDPTITGLNKILAKGTNMLGKIPELLIRFRSSRYAWNTDISKLYNQRHLNKGSLAFSLFLYHDSLSQSVAPEVWVMTRAWYRVASTGNQAGVALEFLAKELSHKHPSAVAPLTLSKYVDDIISPASSKEEREQQIIDTNECLLAGGFTMKYVAHSGDPPPEKASKDGTHVGCLGLA